MVEPYYSDPSGIVIFNCDARDADPSLAVDVDVTDPPYGTDWYATDKDQAAILIPLLSGRASVFGYAERLVRLCVMAKSIPSEWITWWPTNGACRGVNFSGARRESEAIAIFGQHWIAELRQPRSESSRRVLDAGYVHADHGWRGLDHNGDPDDRRVSDVWRDVSPGLGFAHANRRHPNEKPLTLMVRLVEGVSRPGETVRDLFMGSGTTLEACKLAGRKAIGYELVEAHCEVAAKRLSQGVLPFGGLR